MYFVLGFLTGLAASAVLFTILAYFRAGIERRVKIMETQLGAAGPKPKGAIFLPEDENDLTRQQRINKNKAAGKDTRLSELM